MGQIFRPKELVSTTPSTSPEINGNLRNEERSTELPSLKKVAPTHMAIHKQVVENHPT